MDYTCLNSELTSPGVTLPRGDTEVHVGESPFNITCHLNPDHPEYLSGVVSKDLAFKTNTEILNSTIINSTSISYSFNPVEEGVTDISCVILKDNNRASGRGVCTQKIIVGHHPQDVQNFSCVSENWESLNCTWKEPTNPIPTIYAVHFISKGSYFRKCPTMEKLQSITRKEIPKELKMCYINSRTNPHYRQSSRKFYFYVNATNSLSPYGKVFRHEVDHFSIVKPGKARFLRLSSSSPYSIIVRWNISLEMTHFPPGMKQRVRYRNVWSYDEWQEVDVSHLDAHENNFELDLPSPLVPFTEYTVEVSMRANLPSILESLYSTPVTATIRTKSARPGEPPIVSSSSFQIVGDDEKTGIVLYWQMLHPWQYNGPGFSYQVDCMANDEEKLFPIKQTLSYAEFVKIPLNSTLTFNIASANLNGISEIQRVDLTSLLNAKSMLPLSVTKIFIEEDLYTLSWLAPVNPIEEIISYTLFWCQSSSGLDRPFQCDGFMEWKTITTKEIGDNLVHSLLLPNPTSIYQLGVASNSLSSSSGIQWTTCTVKNNRNMWSQVSDFSVRALNENSVHLLWKLECSRTTGLVSRFEIVFCQLDDVSNMCIMETNQIYSVEMEEGNELIIKNLTAYTSYQFTVAVRESTLPLPGIQKTFRAGPPSSAIIVKTDPSAPLPPTNLFLFDVSSDKAILKWDKPTVSNGILCKFKVTLYEISGGQVNYLRNLEISHLNVTLTRLLSYNRLVY